MNWQPIETAPKDGAVVLVFSPVDGVLSSHWSGGLWQGQPWRSANNPEAQASKPTHWMPLPPPPAPIQEPT